MKEYKRKVKVRLLTALNADIEELIIDENKSFDNEIANFSSRHCSDSELFAFRYLFRCCKTYREVKELFDKSYFKEKQIGTIKTYGKRAINRLTAKCRGDKKFSGWVKGYIIIKNQREKFKCKVKMKKT